MKLSDGLIQALGQISQDIAADLYESDPDTANDPQIIAEVCIDANRLTMNGNPECDAEVSALVKEHGYTAVLEECAKHVSLW